MLALSSLMASGCGARDALNRKAISGRVIVDGVAIPNGSVSLQPLVAGGVGSGGAITAGNFSITQEFGLFPGKYRVTITGDDGGSFPVSPGKMPGDEEIPPKKQLVPDSWNEEEQQIEVPDGGPFVFDFSITTK